MKLLLINESEVKQPEDFLKKWVKALSKELIQRKIITKEVALKELTVMFLDTTPAKKINWQFRGKDYATDVLSFEGVDDNCVGELVLCPQVLQKQAVEHKQDYNDELSYMILHGVLHLLGFDHEKSEADAKKMLSLQDEIFQKMRKTT